MNKKVLVWLSGWVDSAVSAALLFNILKFLIKKFGFKIFGINLV